MNIQEAIDAPRIHHQWLPDKVYSSSRFALSPDTLKLLAGMGHHVDRSAGRSGARRPASWSAARAWRRSSKGGGARYNGAIDSRAAAGAAVGY